MNVRSALLIVRLIAEGITGIKSLTSLAKRVERGDVITDADIDANRAEINAAIDSWDAAGKKDSTDG